MHSRNLPFAVIALVLAATFLPAQAQVNPFRHTRNAPSRLACDTGAYDTGGN